MRSGLIGLMALILSTSAAGGQSSCILRNTQLRPVAIGRDSTLAIDVTAITVAPAFLDPVPYEIGDQGKCRLHLSPLDGERRLRITLQPILGTNGAEAGRPLEMGVQMVSESRDELEVSMPVAEVQSGSSRAVDFTIRPRSNAAREYPMQMVVSVGDSIRRMPFTLLLTPPPQISLTTVHANCGLNLCFFAGRPQEIEISGDVGELSLGGGPAVAAGLSDGALVARSARLVSKAGISNVIRLDPGLPTGSYRVEVRLPLYAARLRSTNAADRVAFVDTLTLRVDPPPTEHATLTYLSYNGTVTELRGGSAGVRVRMDADSALTLQPQQTYTLGEASNSTRATTNAEFHVDNITASGDAEGTLFPVTPTRPRTGRDEPPQLLLKDGPRTYRVNLVVTPELRIDRYYVLRVSGDELGGSLRPSEQAALRLEGPGVKYLLRGSLGDEAVSIGHRGVRDSIEMNVTVPRSARAAEVLRLWDAEGVETALPLRIEPAQRPRFPFTEYVWIEQGREGSADSIPFTSGVHPVGGLQRVALRYDPSRVDTDQDLYGVQYLQVDLDLFDAAGNRQGHESRCIAVVPPPVGGRDYAVSGSCERMINNELIVSDLLGAAGRATAQSVMRIRLRHDPERYPKQDVGPTRETRLRRTGDWVIEPRLQLPGPVMTYRGGRTSLGLTFAGALFNFEPLMGDYFRPGGPFSLSGQFGFVVGSAPTTAASTDALTAKLATTAGANLRVRNMAGDVDLDFFAGWVQPLGARGFSPGEGYLVFRPGFSVAIK